MRKKELISAVFVFWEFWFSIPDELTTKTRKTRIKNNYQKFSESSSYPQGMNSFMSCAILSAFSSWARCPAFLTRV